MITKKCAYCNKNFKIDPYAENTAKFCSYRCRAMKQSKFFDSEFQSKMGKRGGKKASEIERKKGINFFSRSFQKEMSKRMVKKYQSKKEGCFNPEVIKKRAMMGVEAHKKNGELFFNSDFQREMGARGIKALRKNKNIIFNKIFFDSAGECEFGMCIHYQIEKLKEGKNYQIKIDRFTYDFLINGLFIEYHPYNPLYSGEDINLNKYYKSRRALLDKTGYKEYPLLIVK